MWQRTEDFRFRYTQVLADGDSQAFNAVNGMVYKTRLHKPCPQTNGHCPEEYKMSDKTVGAWTGQIDRNKMCYASKLVQGCYISNLKRVRCHEGFHWVSFFHSISTNDEPHPPGEDSWSFWQQATATEEETPSHVQYPSSTYLCRDIAEKLVPVYHRFSSEPLLKRVMHGGTQNQNECFNSMICSRCPQNMFFGKRQIGLDLFNSNTCPSGHVSRLTHVNVSQSCCHSLNKLLKPDYIVQVCGLIEVNKLRQIGGWLKWGIV